MADNVDLVRQLWEAFERGGVEAVLEIADPDVEWEPFGGGGKVYRGHEGLREYMRWREDREEKTDARLYTAFARGNCVVGRGEVRISSPHGVVTMQPGWLYEFEGGRLVRFRGFPTQDAAMRAGGLMPDDGRAVVRELWDAFNRRDVDRIVELVTPDCDWRALGGHAYHGPEGVRAYVERSYGDSARVEAQEYSMLEVGDLVAVSGSLEVVDVNGGIAQSQVHWLFVVEDGRIKRAEAFRRREDIPIHQ